MRFQKLLCFVGMTCAFWTVHPVYSATPIPTAPTPRLAPAPGVTATPLPRVDIDSTEDNIQPPAESSASGDDLGAPGGNSSTRAVSPQVTPANPETMQSTMTALFANPGLTTRDELDPHPSPTSKANVSMPVPTNLVLQPTDTPIPSLLDKY